MINSKKILNRNGITYEICKQSYVRKQSILNDILKTIYEKEKNIGKGMQTALSCDFYYILSYIHEFNASIYMSKKFNMHKCTNSNF